MVAVVLGILYLTLGNRSLPVVKHTNSTQSSHILPKEKEITQSILLFSDSESDYTNIDKTLQNKEEYDFGTLIHLGDITHLGESTDLDKYKALINDSDINAYSVPGDRDLWKAHGLQLYNRYLGDSYQVVKLGNTKFLLIDNADEYAGISDEQWQFILKEIKDTDFVFLHNPIHESKSVLLGSKGMGDYSRDVDKQRIALMSLIEENPVKAVFAGDQHLFSESADEKRGDLYYYVIGSISNTKAIGRPSFAILSIYEDGDYYVRKVTL